MDSRIINQILRSVCLISPFVCAIVGLMIMRNKGRSAAAGLLLGWFLNIIGVVIVLLIPHASGTAYLPLGKSADIRQRARRIAGLLENSYEYSPAKDSLVRTSSKKLTRAMEELEEETGEVIEGCALPLVKAYTLAHSNRVEVFANDLSRGDRDAQRVFGILVRSLNKNHWRNPKAYLRMHLSVKNITWLAKAGSTRARQVLQHALKSEDLYTKVILVRFVQENVPDLIDDAEVRKVYLQCFKSQEVLLWQKAVEELWSVISGSSICAEHYLEVEMLEPILSIISPESNARMFTKSCAASLISWFYYSDLLSVQQRKLIDQRRAAVVDKEEYTEISKGEYIDTPEGSIWDSSAEVEITRYSDVTLGTFLENSTYRPSE